MDEWIWNRMNNFPIQLIMYFLIFSHSIPSCQVIIFVLYFNFLIKCWVSWGTDIKQQSHESRQSTQEIYKHIESNCIKLEFELIKKQLSIWIEFKMIFYLIIRRKQLRNILTINVSLELRLLETLIFSMSSWKKIRVSMKRNSKCWRNIWGVNKLRGWIEIVSEKYWNMRVLIFGWMDRL